MRFILYPLFICTLLGCTQTTHNPDKRLSLLVETLTNSPLKEKLSQCQQSNFYPTDFSIAHRGAPLYYPEHTKESYLAAAKMGAGILECDVTFTKDKQLVCRHSQCDLHTTTNILEIPELAAKCSQPFTPAKGSQAASAKCCTSDITLAEFLTLQGKMDTHNRQAKTISQYLALPAAQQAKAKLTRGTVMSHAQSIALFRQLGVKMTPELKAPMVAMPFNGMSQTDYADKFLEQYRAANIAPQRVFAQSFNLADIQHWLKTAPDFAKNSVFLDERNDTQGLDPLQVQTWQPSMKELYQQGVRIIAPPLWMLVTLDEHQKIVPSPYAKAAKAAGLNIVAWSLERSGSLKNGGGWYYQSISSVIKNEGDVLKLLDVLAQEIGVIGVFSDNPATTSFYANCYKMPQSE